LIGIRWSYSGEERIWMRCLKIVICTFLF
jgi:hypothetical protein